MAIATVHDTILIRAEMGGPDALNGQSFLCLPAAIRHRCHIHTGDQLLIAAYPHQRLLVICTIAVLDSLLDPRVSALP
ncbi:hypothetical protein [Actinoplanes sp. NBRC 103695]|uniref:hypothetical protein n=1 Tax=Actinoplanes sp. NBRC 103695 TaxID=3032202 RepID=UPI0024A238A4|nr:hypothetical protein [Actinoplanes sp. NBRC 103695]GLZ01613.1 hypothetical protein Acsp02_88640 [Actinoplanes sp. NBRC 103695]